jgi:hypothetical protein
MNKLPLLYRFCSIIYYLRLPRARIRTCLEDGRILRDRQSGNLVMHGDNGHPISFCGNCWLSGGREQLCLVLQPKAPIGEVAARSG